MLYYMNRKLRVVFAFACAAFMAMAVVAPALGGPSITAIGKTAKKALSVGRHAQRSAADAQRAADGANARIGPVSSAAAAANSKADQALARPVVTLSGLTVVSASAAIPPNDNNSVAAVCPAGQRVISGGAATTSPQGGTWLSIASSDRQAWLAGGEDLSGSGGDVTAEAYCTGTGQAAASKISRVAIQRELHRWEARKAHASKTCGPGYVHANLSWGEKCLRAGQYCKKNKNREYHRYGFHCKRNGRLKRY
jgi:hypothetical protein